MAFLSILAFIFLGQSSAFLDRRIKNTIPLEQTLRCDGNQDCGEEVCITDFLPNDSAGAKKATEVLNVFPDGVTSYAGFASVNATAKNKLFFWYVPPLENNGSTPLLIWLQGGPGGSSLFGMFSEMGPYSVNKDGATLNPRLETWNRQYGMIFIDNPG